MVSAIGIVKEGFRYGWQTHGTCSGVNFYTMAPTSNFYGANASPANIYDVSCICHVLALEGTKLNGGADYRYCVRGPAGHPCKRVTLEAFSVLKCQVPPALLL